MDLKYFMKKNPELTMDEVIKELESIIWDGHLIKMEKEFSKDGKEIEVRVKFRSWYN